MIKLQSYSINNLPITNELLSVYINKFWQDIFESIKDTKHLYLMCKVQFESEEMGYRTLGHLLKTNYSDKELFIEYISERLTVLNESYITLPIINISFSYIIKDGVTTDSDRALSQETDNISYSHRFNNMELPITMDPSEYGTILLTNNITLDGDNYQRYIVQNKNRTFEIDVSSNGLTNKVRILGSINLSWVDTKLDSSILNYFMREIKKSTIYFMNGEVVLRKQQLNAKPFRK